MRGLWELSFGSSWNTKSCVRSAKRTVTEFGEVEMEQRAEGGWYNAKGSNRPVFTKARWVCGRTRVSREARRP